MIPESQEPKPIISYLSADVKPGEVEADPGLPEGELLAGLLGPHHGPRHKPQDQQQGGEGDHRVEGELHPSEDLGGRPQVHPRTLVLHAPVCTNPPRGGSITGPYRLETKYSVKLLFNKQP